MKLVIINVGISYRLGCFTMLGRWTFGEIFMVFNVVGMKIGFAMLKHVIPEHLFYKST